MKRRIGLLAITAIAIACGDQDVTAPPEVAASEEELTLSRLPAADQAWFGGERVYEITLENLTTGQPMSPGVVVTHRRHARVFNVGAQASEGIRLIAENGDPSTAMTELSGARGISDVVSTTAPIHRIGGPDANTLTVRITADHGATRLSVAVMLICTNDGFTGVDGVRLPLGFRPRTYYGRAYDAGTELNDELATSIVPPCGAIGPEVDADFSTGNERTATDDVIRHHEGIQGVGDLVPDLHGWEPPVIKITVRRVIEARRFLAPLSGNQEVPPVETNAKGLGLFRLNRHGDALGYRLFVTKIEDVTQAHIHLGQPGENGPVVAFLFGPVDGESARGLLARGALTDDDVMAVEGFEGTLDALLEELRSGNAYVNVHTLANPSGEIRGQIHPIAFGSRH